MLYRLKNAGFSAFLVGGAVRDLLLGLRPKDFDVATDAHPEQVNELFRNCRLIGRRFRLAHVHFGREIIEVATFRAHHSKSTDEAVGLTHDDGMILRDNVYGTLEDDAIRRDFTVNALYYNIADFSVVDRVNGALDLENKTLNLIGDPETRFTEDPVRMLRATRFAAKLKFTIPDEIVKQIQNLGHRLQGVPAARLFDEMLKLFLEGYAEKNYELIVKHDLFCHLFPVAAEQLISNPSYTNIFITNALKNTDIRIASKKPVTPAFLFAAILWSAVQIEAQRLIESGMPEVQALQLAGDIVIKRQIDTVSIPRRFQTPMREIWVMQSRLSNRRGKRAFRTLENPRFRAAYDFLLLRVTSGEKTLKELADWWTEFQVADENLQKDLLSKVKDKNPKKRRKKRKSKSKSSSKSSDNSYSV
ncbi:Poly(A) polymerase [hydrothermal vent metagenome]|uniref:Poly(A) polymerase n=1 Tax=hydrothermal vent metagenome TaxID=652676 RepID=A0A3B1AJD7_9ZZZZ